MSNKENMFVDIVFVILTIFVCGALPTNEGYYTIVAPGTIRPESKFHISFTLKNYNESCWFDTSFTTFIRNEILYRFERVEIKPETTELIEFLSPSLDTQFVSLQILGYCAGKTSTDTAFIQLRHDEQFGLIQTNKFKYRPGELVQFRLICIDHLKTPSQLRSNISVQIFDDQFNIVKRISDVKFIQGVYRGEFQISNNPLMGIWKIRAIGNGIFTQKTFEVGRYSEPKFNVEVKANIVATQKDQVKLEISASYFHGEPVKGNLTLIVTNTMVPVHSYTPSLPTITRHLQIDGNTTLFLDLKNDFHLEYPEDFPEPEFSAYSFPPGPYKFIAEATVTEDLNGDKTWSETEFSINSEPYEIEIQAPEMFLAEEVIKIEVRAVVKDITKSLVKNPTMKIVVGCGLAFDYNRNLIDFDQVRVEYGNATGEDSVTVNVTNKSYNECYVYATYQGIKSSTLRMYNKVEEFDMEVLTENPEEGKVLQLKISNPRPFEEFSYEIFARGDIIHSERVLLPKGGQTEYVLRFNVTFLMVPKITVFVHDIKNNKFEGQLKDIVVKRAVQNSIKISTDDVALPGHTVRFNVTTLAGSYVGLMALDRRLIQNVDSKDILKEDSVNRKLKSLNSPISYKIPFYGRTADVLTFSNVFPPGIENGAVGELPILKSPELYGNPLPESWLFEDFESTPEGGFSFVRTTPEKSKPWAITGFSIHPDTGLTFTENATYLKTFQNLSVSFDLPSSVRKGEIVEVPIDLTDNLCEGSVVNVTLESDSEELLVFEDLEAGSDFKQETSKYIPGGKRERIVFFLKPIEKGEFNVTVKTSSSTVQKTLNVKSHVMSSGKSDQHRSMTKGDAVLSFAKIFGPLIEDLVEIPLGNSEENMRFIISNSILLKYFKAFNCSNPKFENKLRLNLELGYQNQMTFKHKDGSFELFELKKKHDNGLSGFFSGNNKETGDIRQTAFALWGLNQANESIFIEPKVLQAGAMFLRENIMKGCLRLQSGLDEDVNLTAFVIMVFLMNNNLRTLYGEVIANSLLCLNEDQRVKSYLKAYVLFIAKDENADDYLRELLSKNEVADESIFRSTADDYQSKVTSHLLFNFVEKEGILGADLLKILRGLVFSRNSLMQLLALHAMVDVFEKQPSLVKTSGKALLSDKVVFEDDNSLISDLFQIGSDDPKMSDVRDEYKIIPDNQTSPPLSLNVNSEEYSKFDSGLKVCLNVPANRTQEKSFVMEIELQTGYTFTDDSDRNDFETLKDEIKSLQFYDGRSKAAANLVLSSGNETCLALEIRRRFRVFDSQPGLVTVYGFYGKDQMAIKNFLIDGS